MPRARDARARVRALFLACVVLATRGARASDAKADARGRALALERWARTPTRRWDAAAREEDAKTAARVSESIRIVAEARGAGRGVATTRNVSAGELLAEVPLEKCLCAASARMDARLWRAIGASGASGDAILAAHVLREAFDAGSKSAYWPWLRLLPRDVDSTVGWNEDELSELSGSNVVVFTRAIKAQWRMEYDALDVPTLGEKFPDVFGGERAAHYTFDKFTWARFIIWSRAIDLSTESAEAPTIRVLVPLLDMANHAPGGKLRPEWDARSNAVKVYAASAFREHTELRFNYDTKPSQYFLLQYGFIPETNPAECVEATVRVSDHDSLRDAKEELLRLHGLDPKKRNFEWKPRSIDYDLLAATRVITMDEAEMSDATSLTLAVSGASVSAKNDARTKAVLLKSLASFLESYTTTLAEDNEYVARVDDESNDEPLPGKRKRFAVLLRMREKQILLASADALFKELPDEDQELVKSTCEEIFMNEFDACMTRANGTVFASYEKKTEEERVDESS